MNTHHRHAAAIAITILLAATAALAPGCRASEPAVVGEPPAEATAAPGPLRDISLVLEPVADGFDQPLFVTGAGDDSGRLFVVEKTGRIWTLRDGIKSAEPFLDLSDVVSTESEQGLLGLAFSPGFAEDGTFWVNYTDASGATVVSSFVASGDRADPTSERVWLTFGQPYKNHNGGMIAFGPDGHLYVGTGDGGSGGDPQGNGQDLGTLLGKMLRLNVRLDASETRETEYGIPTDNPFIGVADARPEIWAYGLRNPWRFSFDRATGDLWIGDVGQSAWEEIDFQPAESAGGENYGWSVLEGSHPYPPEATAPADLSLFAMPVVEYDRAAGQSVTGGYVYRGRAYPALAGTYLYGDFGSGRVWGLRADDGGWENASLLETGRAIVSFGEDDDGELYLVDFAGSVWRVTVQ